MTAPFDVLKKGFAALHLSEEHSDCQLRCGPYHFHLHKAVITSQSDYFKAAFKKGHFSEGNTSIIELKLIKNDTEDSDNEFYDDPEIVKLMVNYFYHFDYPTDADDRMKIPEATQIAKHERAERLRRRRENRKENDTSSAKQQNFLIGHVKVFAMAVKYQVDGLRHLAASKFKHETTHGEAWKEDDFPQAISMIYSSAPDEVKELRTLAEEALHAHFDELKQKTGIEDLMYKYPGLMYALLKRKNETPFPGHNRRPNTPRDHLCKRCRRRIESTSPIRDLCADCFRNGHR